MSVFNTREVRIKRYLKQKVMSGSAVTSGISQGSILGPLLFVLYINHLQSIVKNSLCLFADNTKIFARSEVDGATDSLQEDLESLLDWSTKWCLKTPPREVSCGETWKQKIRSTVHSNGEKQSRRIC